MQPAVREQVRRPWAVAGLRLARIGVTITLLVFVIRRAGGPALLHELSMVSAWWLLAASGLNLGVFVLAVLRWRVLITPRPQQLTLGALARVHLTSTFYGAIGPGTLGVDAMRVMLLSGYGTGRTAAAVSVTADRVAGFLGMTTVAMPALASTGWLARMAALPPFGLISEIRGKSRIAAEALAREPWRVAAAYALTLVSLAMWGLVGWCTLAALGHSVPYSELLSFIACAELASALPLSVQGVGVRELVFSALLAPHGVSPADATLLGLLLYAQALLMIAAGAFVSVSSR